MLEHTWPIVDDLSLWARYLFTVALVMFVLWAGVKILWIITEKVKRK